MTDGIVGWTFFDAESGTIPDELRPSVLPDGGAGRIVVLAATPFARAEGWAARAVVTVAGAWAREGLRIFLMDLGLDAPSLHEALDLPNLEGVSDAFLYGASVQRIAQPALDDAFFFAPSGTATTEPEQILAHPRWDDLAGGFSEADATLLLFLPAGIPGGDKILARATDILFLCGEGESADSFLGPASVKILASCGPAGSPPLDGDAIVIDPEIGDGTHGLMPEAAGDSGLVASLLLSDEPGDLHDPGGALEGMPPDSGFSFADEFTAETIHDDGPESTPSQEASEEPFGGDPAMLAEFSLDEDVPGEQGHGEDGSPDLQVGADQEAEIPEFGPQEGPTPEVPDFEADFAAMPDLDPDDQAYVGEADPAPESPPASGTMDSESESSISMGSMEGGEFSKKPKGPSGETDGSPEIPRPAVSSRYDRARERPRSRLQPPPRRKFPWGPILGSILVVLVIAAGGTAAGLFDAPGFGWLKGLLATDGALQVSSRDVVPLDDVLRFSLELDSYGADEREIAIEMRNTLRGRESLESLLFNLSPVEADGVLRYVLYAGPAADLVAAENLRAPLEETLIRDDPGAWPIRETPLAFLLGTRNSLEEAEAFLASVEVAGSLGYIVHVTFPDGAEGYEILSGAFQTAEDARWLQSSLRDAGFRDPPLILRRGSPPE